MKPAFVAFYSFKGGVGRSLALCNLAWSLSRRGRRVLVIDLDLEAPGIDRVRALAPRKDTEPRPGVVELITDYAVTGELPDLEAFTYELPTGDPSGRLWIMPAGLRDAAYQESLSLLDWSNLHPEGGSERFVADLRAKATETFLPHYVLVDSRTGFSDIGGFTTHLLADQVVLVFNLTRACLEGTIQAYRSMISRNDALHFILVASPVPPVADDAGIIGKRLQAAAEHMDRGMIYRQPIIRIDYEARMALTDDLAVAEPEKYGAAARYEKLRDLIQRANPDEVYPAAEDAARHLREGRADDAIELLRAFVEEHPDNADGWAALGDLYRNVRRWSEARGAFDRAIALAPRLPDGHRGRGEVAVAAGDAKAGIEQLKHAEKLGDRSPALYRALRAGYDVEKDIAGLRESGRKLVGALLVELTGEEEPAEVEPERDLASLRSDFVDHLTRFPPYRGFDAQHFWTSVMGSLSFTRAEKLGLLKSTPIEESGEAELRELQRTFDEERADWQSHFGPDITRLMDAVARTGDIDRAQLQAASSDDPQLRAVALTWLATRPEPEAVRADLEAAVEADPTYVPARWRLATALAEAAESTIADLEAAVSHAQIASKHAPERVHVWFSLGYAQSALAKHDPRHAPALRRAAAAAYAAAVEREPRNYEALHNWGFTLSLLAAEAKGDERRALLQDACDRYRRAVDIKPDDYDALNNWGLALSHHAVEAEGDERSTLLRDACDRYRRAVDAKPHLPEALYNWGIALLHLAAQAEGDERTALLHEARQRCEQANAVEPHASDYNLACALSLLGRLDESWALLPGALEREQATRDYALADSDLAPLWAAHPEWRAVIEGG